MLAVFMLVCFIFVSWFKVAKWIFLQSCNWVIDWNGNESKPLHEFSYDTLRTCFFFLFGLVVFSLFYFDNACWKNNWGGKTAQFSQVAFVPFFLSRHQVLYSSFAVDAPFNRCTMGEAWGGYVFSLEGGDESSTVLHDMLIHTSLHGTNR